MDESQDPLTIKIQALCLLLSLALHLALFYIPKPMISESEVNPTDILRLTVVDSNPITAPVISAPAAQSQTPTQKKRLTRKTPTSSPMHAIAKENSDTSQSSKAIANYESLLSVSDGGKQSGERASGAKRYAGKYATELQRESLAFTAHLDLPLVFRRDLKEGVAYADLHSLQAQVRIVSLTGDPHIRAALFEALDDPKNRSSVLGIFRFFGAENFRIVFSLTTDYAPFADAEMNQSVEIFEHEVRIEIVKHLGLRNGNAANVIPIEDDDSRKAKARDHQHLMRLRESPAFMHPIFDYDIK